jgi:hypothetical protein
MTASHSPEAQRGPIHLTPAVCTIDPEYVWPGPGRPFGVTYLFEDRDGEIIYVGCTGNWSKRQGEHRRNATWWPEVARVHLLRCQGSTWDIRVHEYLLIEMLRPRYNRPGARPLALR